MTDKYKIYKMFHLRVYRRLHIFIYFHFEEITFEAGK